MDPAVIAEQLMADCLANEQAVRVVTSSAAAAEVRREVRTRARQAGVRIRTARMQDRVVVVLCSAALWGESAAVMRAKLTPPTQA